MKIFPTVSAIALALTAAQLTSAQDTTNTNFTPAEPGTAAFLKHRPVFHFLARKNWMNDPCGPYYDSDTQLYHMFYQSNTEATTWGNMTWGHAVSKDQVTWEDYPNALKNEDTWDNLGVFSGFARNKAIDGKDTVFYTGVTKLPISWTLPYLFGEHVNYATTSDGGKTWQKGAKPLIELPPAGMNVTGWRDPNAFDSKSLDKAFGISGESHYLITAGGIHDVGSRIFLYHSNNYLDWEYKGFLLSKEKNTTFSEYSGNWGFNFETTNYIEISDAEGVNHNVMMFAAEGTPRRYPMWAVGDISAPSSGKGICGDNDPNQGFFEPKMVGVTEYSDWYANAVFKDPKSGKEVVWGWIVEDNGYEKQPQGWNGILSVPRVVDVAIIKDVYDPENKLDAPGDWIVSSKRDVGACGANTAVTAKTIKTLAFQPFEQLDLMRGDKVETVASATLSKTDSEKVLSSTGKSFELYAEVPSFEAGSKVGFKVRRSSEQDEYTSIVYDDATKKIVIDRSKSSTADCSPFVATNKPNAKNTEGWFHHYSTVQGSGAQCTIKPETLKFRVYVDVSVVEVFVNDRFVISSRVYPCEGKTASDGISLMSTGAATFENVKVWTNPKKAWADNRQIKQF